MTATGGTAGGLLLVTGAAGSVGQQLLPGLADRRLRLLDRAAPAGAGDADVVIGELTDRDLLDHALDGVAAVVHLAGEPDPDATWDRLRGPNVDGFAALLEAAATHGVPRVVYASSVHAMGRYEAAGRMPIDPAWVPAPCCLYGATKVFDEAVAGMVTSRGGPVTIGLRLGATVPEPTEHGQLPGWLGPADLRRLVRSALGADVPGGVYPGVSANTGGRWDLGSARAELGYQPQLDSADHADRVGRDGPDTTTCPPRRG